ITVHAIGTTSRNEVVSEPHGGSTETYSPTLDSQNIYFSIDTSIFSTLGKGNEYVTTEFSIKKDTLLFSYSYTDTSFAPYFSSRSESIIIAFVPHKDSILSLSCGLGSGSNYGPISNSSQYSLYVTSLAFDDTSIYCSDSIGNHNAEFTVSSGTSNYLGPNSTQLGTFDNSSFKASTMLLLGNFRSKFFLLDSTIQFSPLHLPSQILVHAIGIEDSDGQSFPSSQDFSWPVSNAPLINDVLQVSDSYYGHEDLPPQTVNSSSSFEISFVHGTDSIAFISLDNSYQDIGPNYTTSLTFQISSVAYDSTMIFTTDSSFCNHNISLSWSTSGGNSNIEFTATSADLYGIFRPTNYTCAESVSEPQPAAQPLLVTTSNNSLRCSFGAAFVARELEVYSILGTRVASMLVPTGAVESTISGLPPGFYLVRFGNAVAKAIVTE
ncbi:MAG: hypothetical protein ACRDF4_03335, partial [Rhabdochlamydiaceae bacterium]